MELKFLDYVLRLYLNKYLGNVYYLILDLFFVLLYNIKEIYIFPRIKGIIWCNLDPIPDLQY